VVALIIAIERAFNISIDERELDIKLFQNLSVLAKFIEEKRVSRNET
jgi:acyl carrier protein